MRSIRTYLVAMLMAAFTLVTFLAALNGYLISMREAEQLLDRQLSHASSVLQQAYSGGAEQREGAAKGEEFAFQVWRAGQLLFASPRAPVEPIGELEAGYRFANFGGYRWRVFTRVAADGDVFVVAERADLRYLIAEKVVLKSVLPLVLWLPVSALLVWVVVGWGLKPLRDLGQQINARRSDDLSPVALERPPLELVRLIESANSLLARLSAAFEREKEFASHAAHELRTPLSILKVHLHNLGAELPAGEPSLAHANAGVERMCHLVEQVLDLSRTNPDLRRAEFRPLELHALARRVTAQLWPAFEEKGLALELDGDEPASLSGDEALLEILLENLLDNARKYTPDHGAVRVRITATDSAVELAVEDSGPGIAEDQRERVFQRFYRASPDAASGSGLGLAIVEHIVRAHGARIALQRSELGGLAARVSFPR